MNGKFRISLENINEDSALTDIISILEDHDLLHNNKDLHNTISSDVENLNKIENEFHNELTVSFESYQNETIALETIMDTLKAFWDRIVAFIKTIIEKIAQFFQNHFSLLSRRKKHIAKLIQEYNEIELGVIKHETSKDIINIKDSKWAYVNNKLCNTGDTLLEGIKGLVKETNFIFNDYLLTVIKRGEFIETAIKQLKNNKNDDVYKSFTTDFIHKGIKEFEIFLLDNKTFSLKKPKIDNNLSFPDSVKQIADIKVDITDTIDLPKNQNIDFKNIQVSEAKNILSELLTLIEEFETFNKTRYKEVLKVGERIRDDSDNLMKHIENLFKSRSDDPDEHKQLTSIKALIGLNPAYIRWVKTPTTDLIQIGTDCVFHTCSMLEKNIQKYNKRTSLNILSVIGAM